MGFSPDTGFFKGILFVGCLLILSSFFEPETTSKAEVNVKVAQLQDNIMVSVSSIKNDSHTQFYMFNIDGKLIKNYDISGSKKIIIEKLQKGIYLYEFFCKDARLKNGQIELK